MEVICRVFVAFDSSCRMMEKVAFIGELGLVCFGSYVSMAEFVDKLIHRVFAFVGEGPVDVIGICFHWERSGWLKDSILMIDIYIPFWAAALEGPMTYDST